ncbi:unnamed protein product [Rotaria sp. Silwood1]|nr:unnamed protein product [Rotaria sp. Silwood1]
MQKWEIFGKNFTVSNKGLTYFIGICSSPNNSADDTAIIQKENSSSHVLGKLDQVNLVRGDDWILLTYKDGDPYKDACNNSTRSASIMFVCGQNKRTNVSDLMIKSITVFKNSDINQSVGYVNLKEELRKANLTILQEHTSTDHHCNYMFQLRVPEMCPPVEKNNKLSGSAIFLIIFFSVTAAYLFVGAVFMHVKHGARGIDHIPNLEMWRKLGNLAADGCEFCCRCERTSPRAGYFLDESGPDMRDDDILSP